MYRTERRKILAVGTHAGPDHVKDGQLDKWTILASESNPFSTLSIKAQSAIRMSLVMRSSSLLVLVAGLSWLSAAQPLAQPLLTFVPPSELSPRGVHNLGVVYQGELDGELRLTYGHCDSTAHSTDTEHRIGTTHIGAHPLAARHVDHKDRRPTKFVWLTPTDLGVGCLRAFLDDQLVGQSEELVPTRLLPRRSEKKTFAEIGGDDGIWFDGVAYLQQKQPDDVFVASAKSKTIGILGGGMSGLMASVS